MNTKALTSHADHVALNAARIGYELSLIGSQNSPSLVRFGMVADASQSLAALEARQDFRWNEDGRTDWESACARIAKAVSKGEVSDWDEFVCDEFDKPARGGLFTAKHLDCSFYRISTHAAYTLAKVAGSVPPRAGFALPVTCTIGGVLHHALLVRTPKAHTRDLEAPRVLVWALRRVFAPVAESKFIPDDDPHMGHSFQFRA